jgi:hypothetical protein
MSTFEKLMTVAALAFAVLAIEMYNMSRITALEVRMDKVAESARLMDVYIAETLKPYSRKP